MPPRSNRHDAEDATGPTRVWPSPHARARALDWPQDDSTTTMWNRRQLPLMAARNKPALAKPAPRNYEDDDAPTQRVSGALRPQPAAARPNTPTPRLGPRPAPIVQRAAPPKRAPAAPPSPPSPARPRSASGIQHVAAPIPVQPRVASPAHTTLAISSMAVWTMLFAAAALLLCVLIGRLLTLPVPTPSLHGVGSGLHATPRAP